MNEVYKQKFELTTNCVVWPDYSEEELEEKEEKDTRELEEEKTADEDIDIEKTHNNIFWCYV